MDTLDTTFTALSDPTRRAMIERLAQGPASVHALTAPFPHSQQMISKHIAYLVRARMVIKTKRGRESVCTLRPEALKTVSDWAFRYRRFWEESFDKLDVVVNQIKKTEGDEMTRNTGNAVERMVVTRIFNAPREIVWNAWTNPDYARQWWGPYDFTTPVYKMDLRVGGKFLICMRSPDGQEFWNGGEYHEIVPQERIVLSMYFSDAQGNRVEPAHYGLDHKAVEDAFDVVTFEDLGDGRTRLTFVGNESMEEAQKSGQVEGWNQILEKFAVLVESLAQTK